VHLILFHKMNVTYICDNFELIKSFRTIQLLNLFIIWEFWLWFNNTLPSPPLNLGRSRVLREEEHSEIVFELDSDWSDSTQSESSRSGTEGQWPDRTQFRKGRPGTGASTRCRSGCRTSTSTLERREWSTEKYYFRISHFTI